MALWEKKISMADIDKVGEIYKMFAIPRKGLNIMTWLIFELIKCLILNYNNGEQIQNNSRFKYN